MVDQRRRREDQERRRPVNITIESSPTDANDDPPLADRVRTRPAFGGAIRDMWNPNCYGDPGKVSDEEYHCDRRRLRRRPLQLGCHQPHYALLVDGVARFRDERHRAGQGGT